MFYGQSDEPKLGLSKGHRNCFTFVKITTIVLLFVGKIYLEPQGKKLKYKFTFYSLYWESCMEAELSQIDRTEQRVLPKYLCCDGSLTHC